MKAKKLGQKIVVTVENDGTDDAYLNVTDTAEEAAEHGVTKRAAVYVLQERIIIESVPKVTPAK